MRVILLTTFLMAQPVFAVCQTPANQQPAAPDFALRSIKGRSARLKDFKGKVLLINFWATWCPPCLAEMPELVKLQKEHKARGLQIIGVTYEPEPPRDVRRLARKFKLNYPVLFGTSAMSDAYQIGEALPTTVVIDRNGKIRARILGILEPEDFREKVAPLL